MEREANFSAQLAAMTAATSPTPLSEDMLKHVVGNGGGDPSPFFVQFLQYTAFSQIVG